jgi:hypothetical protein
MENIQGLPAKIHLLSTVSRNEALPQRNQSMEPTKPKLPSEAVQLYNQTSPSRGAIFAGCPPHSLARRLA